MSVVSQDCLITFLPDMGMVCRSAPSDRAIATALATNHQQPPGDYLAPQHDQSAMVLVSASAFEQFRCGMRIVKVWLEKNWRIVQVWLVNLRDWDVELILTFLSAVLQQELTFLKLHGPAVTVEAMGGVDTETFLSGSIMTSPYHAEDFTNCVLVQLCFYRPRKFARFAQRLSIQAA